ncbi:rCG30033 [Rattus norvegicus]|uniref:RCG30033 n=1 Tax=Rattus norvegicus TaxID=10116 RepID=A6IN06_RAT|nr:rCG30033 [Rattus norvegicus]
MAWGPLGDNDVLSWVRSLFNALQRLHICWLGVEHTAPPELAPRQASCLRHLQSFYLRSRSLYCNCLFYVGAEPSPILKPSLSCSCS